MIVDEKVIKPIVLDFYEAKNQNNLTEQLLTAEELCEYLFAHFEFEEV